MHYTYILESIRTANRYIGHTSDLKRRIHDHNAGKCPATRSSRPWKVVVFIAFETQEQALHFEAYLKTGSGHAFANRHFWRTKSADQQAKKVTTARALNWPGDSN